MRTLKRATAYELKFFVTESANHVIGKTGLVTGNFTVALCKDGGTFSTITVTVTELAYGWYKLPLTTAHTDTNGDLALHMDIAGGASDAVDVAMQVRGNVLGDTLPANALQVLSNNLAEPTPSNLAEGISKFFADPSYITASQASADRITDTYSLVGTLPKVLASGTATAGSANTITLAASPTFANNILNGNIINIPGGTVGVAQSRVIISNTGQVVTVDRNWTTNPTTASQYQIVEGSVTPVQIWNELLTNIGITGSIAELIKTGAPADLVKIMGSLLTQGAASRLATNFSVLVNNGNIASTALLSDITTIAANTVGLPRALTTGTVVGSTLTTVVQIASTPAYVTNLIVGNIIRILTGTGAGQSRLITAFDATTDVATISPAWVTQPIGGSTYDIVEGAHSTASAPDLSPLQTDLDNIQSRLPAALTGLGNIKASLEEGTLVMAEPDAEALAAIIATDPTFMDSFAKITAMHLVKLTTAASANLNRSANAIGTITAASSPNPTTVVTSSVLPTITIANQFANRIMIFENNTPTAALQGAATMIVSHTIPGVFTVSPALPGTPGTGDKATIT